LLVLEDALYGTASRAFKMTNSSEKARLDNGNIILQPDIV
jgi:hypothetical protein